MKTFFVFFSPLLVLLAFALASGGCGKPIIIAEKQDSNDTSGQPALKRVEMGGDLARALEIVSVNQATVNEDLLKLQANVKNVNRNARRITYKIEWMDENGIVVNDSSNVWIPLRIRGGETAAIQSVATTPRAKDFRIKLQAARVN